MSFDDPDQTVGGGDRFNPRDIVNHLLLVWVIEYVEHSPTKFTKPGQNADMVVVDVVDLDQVDPETNDLGLLSRGCWWRQGRLIGALKKKAGSPHPILAFMTQGTASPGMNAPFELLSARTDPGCVAKAELWLEKHPDFQPSQPYVPPTNQYVQPVAVPLQRPVLPPPPQPTVLERLAQQAKQGAARMPTQTEKPPF